MRSNSFMRSNSMPTAASGDGRQWWETAVSFVSVPYRFKSLYLTVTFLLQVFRFHHVS